MNEIPLDKDEDELINASTNPLSSTTEEVDDIAEELATGYLSYLNVDLAEERQRLDQSIEECLTYLEEVSSLWDNYKKNNLDPREIAETIKAKSESLEELYDQIDSLEQYIFVTNQTLNKLDTALKDIESKQPVKSKIKQIIDILPKLSINIPRFGL